MGFGPLGRRLAAQQLAELVTVSKSMADVEDAVVVALMAAMERWPEEDLQAILERIAEKVQEDAALDQDERWRGRG